MDNITCLVQQEAEWCGCRDIPLLKFVGAGVDGTWRYLGTEIDGYSAR